MLRVSFLLTLNSGLSRISFVLIDTVSMGFGHRNCVVIGCPTIGQRLGKWAAMTFVLYGCNNGLGKLFPFPTEKKNPEHQLQWAKNISRNSLNGILWMPNKDSRVCNLHFMDRSSSRTGSIFFINTLMNVFYF